MQQKIKSQDNQHKVENVMVVCVLVISNNQLSMLKVFQISLKIRLVKIQVIQFGSFVKSVVKIMYIDWLNLIYQIQMKILIIIVQNADI